MLVLIHLRLQPLPKKLILRKKRAREGKSSEEVEQFPVPRSVTVRRRSDVAIKVLTEEDPEVCKSLPYSHRSAIQCRFSLFHAYQDYVPSKGNLASRSGRGSMDGSSGRLRRMSQDMEADNFSGAEDDMSD